MRWVMLLTTLAIGISQAAIDPINQDTLKKYLENGTPSDFILIDVRGSEEIQSAIGNAACKPYNLAWPTQFQSEYTRIPKDATVVIYCRSGGRAMNAVSYLRTNGYTSVHNAGGFLTWTGPTVLPSEIKPVTLLPEPSKGTLVVSEAIDGDRLIHWSAFCSTDEGCNRSGNSHYGANTAGNLFYIHARVC